MSRRDKGEDKGRCIYCGRVTTAPAKPEYEVGEGGASSRWSHHRRVVMLNGHEVKPLCEGVRA